MARTARAHRTGTRPSWGRAWLVAALVGCGGSPAPGAETPPPTRAAPSPLRLRVVELPPEADAEGALVADEAALVREDVAARRSGEHGALPPVTALTTAGTGPPAWPRIGVVNGTPHGLVVWFAGPCPRTVGLAPRQTFEVELCAGDYDIAAQLDHPDYVPFVGQGDRVDDGYTYRLTFYVVAEPGAREPRRLRRR